MRRDVAEAAFGIAAGKLGLLAEMRKRRIHGTKRIRDLERVAVEVLDEALGRAARHAIKWAERQVIVHGKAIGVDLAKDADDAIDDEAFVILSARMSTLLVESASVGYVEVGEELSLDFETPPAAALAFAEERAAEMIGKRLVDGSLVDNPNAQWAITDTLRDDVQGLVNSALEEGWSRDTLARAIEEDFGKWRSEMIARTELTKARNIGAAKAYKAAGVEYLDMYDGDGCLPDGHDDGAGAPDEEPGVQDDAEVDGQIWTPDEYAMYPTGHPNCVRAAAPSEYKPAENDGTNEGEED